MQSKGTTMFCATAIKAAADEDGSVILTCSRKGIHGGLHVKRLTKVNFEKFNTIEAARHLGGFRSALLAYRLNRYRERFDLLGILDNRAADTAVARWIASHKKSVERIAAAPNDDERLYSLAINALLAAVNKKAEDNEPIDLQNLGADRMQTTDGYMALGAHDAIVRWFETAKLLKTLIKVFEAVAKEKKEKGLNTQHGFKDLWPDGVSRERWLYGTRLPSLYERITKKRFGISKMEDGATILVATGVAFVIEAASAIGLSVTAANVAGHYYSAKKDQKSRR